MPETTIIFGGSLIALAVGLLTGLFGVGGGFLITPALIMLGLPPGAAVGTSVAVILVNSIIGLYKRRGSATVDVRLALVIGIGSLAGVQLGYLILRWLKFLPPLEISGRPIPAAEYILMWIFLAMLLAVSAFLAFDYRRQGGKAPARRVGLLAKMMLPGRVRFYSLEHKKQSVVALVLLGMTVGVFTGLLGVGGVLMLPALVYLVGQRTAKAAGTSLMVVAISVAAATFLNLADRHIDFFLAAVLIVAGIAGTSLGTSMAIRLNGPRMRFYFIYVVLAAALVIAARLIQMSFAC